VAACVEEDQDHRYFMRIDRSPIRPNLAKLPLSINAIFQRQEAITSVKIAFDQDLLYVETGRGPIGLQATIAFADDRPTLRQLSFLLQVVDIDAYAQKSHAYLFCETIIRSLELKYKPKGAVTTRGVGTFEKKPTWRRINQIARIWSDLYPQSELVIVF
jgi:hypothetical protein